MVPLRQSAARARRPADGQVGAIGPRAVPRPRRNVAAGLLWPTGASSVGPRRVATTGGRAALSSRGIWRAGPTRRRRRNSRRHGRRCVAGGHCCSARDYRRFAARGFGGPVYWCPSDIVPTRSLPEGVILRRVWCRAGRVARTRRRRREIIPDAAFAPLTRAGIRLAAHGFAGG